MEKLEGLLGGFGDNGSPVSWRDDTKVVNAIFEQAIDLLHDCGANDPKPISSTDVAFELVKAIDVATTTMRLMKVF